MGRSYEDLVAWKKAVSLVTELYSATANFPERERFGLTQQMRRAAVSIPSNIAEGQGRPSLNDFHHFLGIARGSLLELETQVHIATNLNFLSPQQAETLLQHCHETGRVLNGLMTAIDRSRNSKAARDA